MLIPASIVILTKNEELNIAACIRSAQAFSEIVIVDSLSEDSTVQIAEELGARVVSFNWDGQYPKKRQWTLENIAFSNQWILFLDADERIGKELENELKNFVSDLKQDGYSAGQVRMKFFFAGKPIKFGYKIRSTKFLKVGKCNYPVMGDLQAPGMGEMEGHYQPVISGKIKKFKEQLEEHDEDPISSWAHRHVNYANWEAYLLNNRKLKESVDSTKSRFAWVFHKLPFRPLIIFLYSYFLKFGFLDGRAGFDYAFGYSWYYWFAGVVARENSLRETKDSIGRSNSMKRLDVLHSTVSEMKL